MKIVNRKAYYEFIMIETFSAGVILTGSEVKSIRRNNASIVDSYAVFRGNEIWLKGLKVAKYKQTHCIEEHDENRDKKLLLNKREIKKIEKFLQNTGITIVPLELFIENNKIKVKIAIAKGKKLWNKKESIKKRDIDLQTKRELNN
jgi:SsrA-binding protein